MVERLSNRPPSLRASGHPRALRLLAVGLVLAACSYLISPVTWASGATRKPAVTKGQFIIQCEDPVGSLPDDPIVYPGQPGASHNHEFYGSVGVNAFSDPDTMRQQPTGCSRDATGGDPGDTSAYWHPTLYVNGQPLHATKSTFYYTSRGKVNATIKPFPANLKIIAGNAQATAPQGTKIVYWGCGNGDSVSKVERPPQCLSGDTGLTLHVLFPDCWNGRDLDSADHKSHMAYATNGKCPASHPVPMPMLIMRITWERSYPDPASLSLSSGSVDTMHADFWNTWNQARLEQLVAACVTAGKDCSYKDVDALPFPT